MPGAAIQIVVNRIDKTSVFAKSNTGLVRSRSEPYQHVARTGVQNPDIWLARRFIKVHANPLFVCIVSAIKEYRQTRSIRRPADILHVPGQRPARNELL